MTSFSDSKMVKTIKLSLDQNLYQHLLLEAYLGLRRTSLMKQLQP